MFVNILTAKNLQRTKLKGHVKIHKSVVGTLILLFFWPLLAILRIKYPIDYGLLMYKRFLKSVTSDIKNAIDEVTGNSFDEIGRKRLKMVQRELFEHNLLLMKGGFYFLISF